MIAGVFNGTRAIRAVAVSVQLPLCSGTGVDGCPNAAMRLAGLRPSLRSRLLLEPQTCLCDGLSKRACVCSADATRESRLLHQTREQLQSVVVTLLHVGQQSLAKLVLIVMLRGLESPVLADIEAVANIR